MIDFKKIIVLPSTSIIETIKVIDDGALQIALVVDENNRLLGTVTDGDIRRGILKGISLHAPVKEVMNINPLVLRENEEVQSCLEIAKQKNLKYIPIVNQRNELVGLEVLSNINLLKKHRNLVVLMAGGLGTRLRPLTNKVPKPLLKVGNKPILEIIIERFKEQGFSNFLIAVNYKKEMIENYFQDGKHLNVNISYLREEKRLGTAGALSLIQDRPDLPIIVMNGDILTKVNFEQLLQFHNEHQSTATMCVRDFEYQIPYGVIKTKNYQLIEIEEKPIQRYFVNAGIYVLNPDVLDFIPKNTFFDMPELFQSLVSLNYPTMVFPIREYWIDIGQLSDYHKVNTEFTEGVK